MRRITAVRITVSKRDGTHHHVERGCSRGLPMIGLQCSAAEWLSLESAAASLGALESGAGAYIMLEIDRKEIP